ncbi:MAG: GNAT family protein [Agitococcus sp.]|nr:GNAT family protein [Agitococcus sp.]MDO9178681.1 GNAT family protein [Agitococcus sp.]
MSINFHNLNSDMLRFNTRRLGMRPVQLADAKLLFEATQNVHFNKHLLWRAPDTEEASLQRMHAMLTAIETGMLAAGSVIVKDTGEWVGILRYQPVDTDSIEVGAWTHPKSWGKRHAMEFAIMGPTIPMHVTTIPAVVGRTDADNIASIRLMTLAGMEFSRKFISVGEDGVSRDSHEYALRRENWCAPKLHAE